MSSTFVDREAPQDGVSEEAAYRLAAIVSSSDDAIVSKDLNGIVMSWNHSAERIFGYTAEEMIGQSIRKIIPADRQSEEDEVLARLRCGERIDHFDTIRQRKDGSLVDISLTISPVHDRHGRIIGASKIARDVSDRKAAEEAIRQSIALKDQFLSMVSHELRTPIATVLGNSQLLLRRGHLLQQEDKQQALTDIVTETERLERIIENLLMLSRMDAGRALKTEPIQLARLVDEAIVAFKRRAPEREITVTSDADMPIACGEPSLVTHVLENLLGNARKYSPPHSEIEVDVGVSDNDEPQVSIRDRGIGFSEDDTQQLFTPFFRAKAASLVAGGMGLGLAVCKRVIEVQGGSICARPRPGGGAEFCFTLPTA